MAEFVFTGRGGQGVVIAQEIFAKAFFYEGFEVKAFPSFGTERRGAPVKAFVKVSDKEIKNYSQIYNADYYVVFDSSQYGNLPKNSKSFVNSNKNIDGSFTLDANKIALSENLGSATNPIVNTAILGAVTALFKGLSIESLKKAIVASLPKHLVDANLKSAEKAFEQMKIEANENELWSLV